MGVAGLIGGGTSIDKRIVNTYRGDTSIGYIHLATMSKKDIYGLNNQVMITVTSTYNNIGSFIVTAADTAAGAMCSVIPLIDNENLKFYYRETESELSIYIISANNVLTREVISAPQIPDKIGAMVFVSEPGPLMEIIKK